MTDPTAPLPIAGWYPDPENAAVERWWNGTGWSDNRRPSTVAAVPPSGPAPTTELAFPEAATASAPALAPSYATMPGPGPAPYGTPVGYGYGYGAAPPKNTPALVGFILALSGVLISIFGLNAIAGGIVSVVGLRRSRELAAKGFPPVGRGFAIAGIAVGFTVGILTLLFWIAYIGFIVWIITVAPELGTDTYY